VRAGPLTEQVVFALERFGQVTPPLLSDVAPVLAAREHISDHREALLRSEAADFLVVDATGRYVGIATQGSLLEPPRAADPGGSQRALPGGDRRGGGGAASWPRSGQRRGGGRPSSRSPGEIVAVLDHHRVGDLQTAAPIPFVVESVGSTSTLVAEQCRERALEPPAGLAGMLLSGILSDTLGGRRAGGRAAPASSGSHRRAGRTDTRAAARDPPYHLPAR
jgi:manganese-dependent inorganic pyrophosphatase